MVENNPTRRRRTVHAADWADLYNRYRHGEDPQVLAEDYDLALDTVKTRCRWVEKIFPTTEQVQKLITLRQRLERAEARLGEGDPQAAEREAKAILALIRAARALESWTMEKPNSKTPDAPASEPEVSSDYDDPRAELQRRYLRLLEFEKKRLGDTGDTDPVHAGRPTEI